MRMRVREQGNEVYIELSGVAGRQHRVLQALTECQRTVCAHDSDQTPPGTEVSVRAGSNDMRIWLKGREGLRFEASVVYRCLRHALFEHKSGQQSSIAAA